MSPSFPEPSLTETRDLRTGHPVWRAYASASVRSKPLSSPGKFDVAIVGAGITGALLALATASKGLTTVVLDRRSPGQGSTAASTALLQWEIDTPLVRLADKVGFERASRAWRRSFRAVSDLVRLVGQNKLSCALASRRALYLSGNVLSAGDLAEEGRQRQKIGLPSAYLSGSQLRARSSIDREAALLSDGVADVNPVRLTDGLLHQAIILGCRVHAPTQLAEVVSSGNRVEMVTADGVELEARALVFATGYELADGVPANGHRRTSTYAFATRCQPQHLWKGRELIWEAAKPYLYIRTSADGRAIVGGEDEDFSDEARRDALLPGKITALQAKTRRLFPQLDVTADYSWAGTFGESDNGLPSIGAVPGRANCYAVLGYGGNGFTFGVIAAQILAARLCGQKDPDEDLFAFSERNQA